MLFKTIKSMIATVVLTSTGLAFGTQALATENSLNVLIWGVTWQSAIKDLSAEFTQKTGVQVNFVTQGSSGEGLVKLKAMKADPTVDVWFTTASVAARAVADHSLFAPLPVDRMPNLKHLAPGTATANYVGIYSYPMSIIYRTDLVKKPITSWSDLWEPRFKHKLAVPAMSMYQGRTLMIASMLDGGTSQDTDHGFEMLKKLKPNVVIFYGSDAQARQALAQGEVSVLVAPPSQGKRVSDAGRPVKVISPKPAIMNFDVATIVQAGNEDLAADYINFLLSKEANETIAKKLSMSAVNVDSAQPASLVGQLPRAEEEVIIDESFINEHIGEWNDRFNREIIK